MTVSQHEAKLGYMWGKKGVGGIDVTECYIIPVLSGLVAEWVPAELVAEPIEDMNMNMNIDPLQEYLAITRELLVRRKDTSFSQDTEAEYAERLEDCRQRMTADEQDRLGDSIQRLRNELDL